MIENNQKEYTTTGIITIDEKLMKLAKPDAIFMHCLPAYYGYEVTKRSSPWEAICYF
jgi:ornithine carbamoyltransferase